MEKLVSELDLWLAEIQCTTLIIINNNNSLIDNYFAFFEDFPSLKFKFTEWEYSLLFLVNFTAGLIKQKVNICYIVFQLV